MMVVGTFAGGMESWLVPATLVFSEVREERTKSWFFRVHLVVNPPMVNEPEVPPSGFAMPQSFVALDGSLSDKYHAPS